MSRVAGVLQQSTLKSRHFDVTLFNLGVFASFAVFLAAVSALGCHSPRERKFPTQEAAIHHFRDHQAEFQTLADDWLNSSHQNFYWFGRSLLGMELFTWDGYWVYPNWFALDVMHWNGHKHVRQLVSTLDEAARIAGTTGAKVLYWQRRLANLGIDAIKNETGAHDGRRIKYLELEYFPARRPYGFRFARAEDALATAGLEVMANRQHARNLRMNRLGAGWFYYEGLWTAEDVGFKRR